MIFIRIKILIVLVFISVEVFSQTSYPDNVHLTSCYQLPQSFAFGIKQLKASTESLVSTTTPVVGDVDLDGESEILSFSEGIKDGIPTYRNIFVFDGKTLNKEATINTPYTKNCHIPAIADVDGVGGEPPYIFIASDSTYALGGGISTATNSSSNAFFVFAYKFDKASGQYVQVWKSNTQIDASSASTTMRVADLNNDGYAEVIVGRHIFNGLTGVLLAVNDKLTQSIPNTRDNSYMFLTLPFVGNLVGDNKLELAYLNEIYSVNLTNTNSFNSNAFVKLFTAPSDLKNPVGNFVGADFNHDGHIDLFMVNRSSFNETYSNTLEFFIWDVFNNRTLAYSTFSLPFGIWDYYFFSGVPSIGDVNGDGNPDICVISKNVMLCYTYTGSQVLTQLWKYPVVDPSGNTGLTFFDFNQDGNQEIVYRDEDNLRIIDGSGSYPKDNALITCGSPTANEMPIVADVNNDGAAEIVIIGGGYHRAGEGSLHVYSSSTSNKWSPARSVWNQAAYNVINVNKDLTIPKVQFNQAYQFPNQKYPFNTYLQQATSINQDGNPFVSLVPDTTKIDTTIYKGQVYHFGNKDYTSDVVDSIILKNKLGCDSLVYLNLKVLSSVVKQITDSMCPKGTYLFGNKVLTNPGLYVDTITTTFGLDSIVSLNLQLKKAIYKQQFVANICSGEVYHFNNHIYSLPGLYLDTLQSTNGCDSIVSLQLTSVSIKKYEYTDSICPNSTYAFGTKVLHNSGTYSDTLKSYIGCDSIITVHLLLKQPIKTYLNMSICPGSTYYFNNNLYNSPGIYLDTLQTVSGCDSIVSLNLTNTAIKRFSYSDSICPGSVYSFHSKILTNPGIYNDTLKTLLNCDSIITLNLYLKKAITKTIKAQICTGSSYVYNGKVYSLEGSYTNHFTSISGCDSIVTLIIKYIPLVVKNLDVNICEGETYVFGADTIRRSGVYTKALADSKGCDSTITLNLDILKKDTTFLFETIERGNVYLFNSMMLKKSGRFISQLKSVLGCDSVVILELNVVSGSQKVKIPDVYTPNSDGKNDYFEIKNLDLYLYNRIVILNRWGNKVFEAEPYLNNWDGRNSYSANLGGSTLPSGTYFYILELGDGSNPIRGSIYLNR